MERKNNENFLDITDDQINTIYDLQEGSSSLTKSQVKKITQAVNLYRTEIVE